MNKIVKIVLEAIVTVWGLILLVSAFVSPWTFSIILVVGGNSYWRIWPFLSNRIAVACT